MPVSMRPITPRGADQFSCELFIAQGIDRQTNAPFMSPKLIHARLISGNLFNNGQRRRPGRSWAAMGGYSGRVADAETGRVDSWIWSVRLVKTRSAAASACRAGHVRVNGTRVKPSHTIRPGDEIRVRQEDRERI